MGRIGGTRDSDNVAGWSRLVLICPCDRLHSDNDMQPMEMLPSTIVDGSPVRSHDSNIENWHHGRAVHRRT